MLTDRKTIFVLACSSTFLFWVPPASTQTPSLPGDSIPHIPITGNESGWTDDGTVVRLTTPTDKVGIGTDSPQEKLEVEGDIRITGKATIGGNTNTGADAFVAGYANNASGSRSTIGGGTTNTASGYESTIGGGEDNIAGGNQSTIGGGWSNTANGNFSTIPGGSQNSATGNYSFAVGHRANSIHDGTFVWADATNEDFASTGPNQFLIRASGNVGIGTTSPDSKLHVVGDGKFEGKIEVESTNPYLRLFDTDTGESMKYHYIIGRDNSIVFQNYDGQTWNTPAAFYTDKLLFYEKVGIGTSDPISWTNLDIYDDGTNGGSGDAYIRLRGAGSGYNFSGINFSSGEPVEKQWEFVHKQEPVFLNHFQLAYHDGSHWSVYLDANPTGNIGIGTTDPQAKLDVNGSIKIGSETLSPDAATGTITFDDDYIYVKTSSGWKRARLCSFDQGGQPGDTQ